MSAMLQGSPPTIEGYDYQSTLGSGGFADVFLYQQRNPQRPVAIKVLRNSFDDVEARTIFQAEADLMAKVSAHPNVVTIYSTGVAQDRRPYLVMEHYPPPHFGVRMRQSPIPFDRVLEVGIKIACAVETAHRALIMHRDIKPANILTSQYGEPGLTDFGISAIQSDMGTSDSVGFTSHYAPPEIISEQHGGDGRADVYSLGATLWAFLAGSAPFDRPGPRMSEGEIASRVLREPLPPLPPGVAPPDLEAVLRHAMDKRPDGRPSSAHSFAVLLQGVERGQQLRPTPLVLPHDPTIQVAAAELDVLRTRKGSGIRVIQEPATPGHQSGPGLITTVPLDRNATRLRSRAHLGLGAGRASEPSTVKRPAKGADPGIETAVEATRPTPKWLWVGAIAAVVVIVGVFLASLLTGAGKDTSLTDDTIAREVAVDLNPGFAAALEAPTNVQATRNGSTVTFIWSHPGGEGVQYRVEVPDKPEPVTVDSPTITLTDVPADQPVCITVFAFVMRSSQFSDSSDQGCTS